MDQVEYSKMELDEYLFSIYKLAEKTETEFGKFFDEDPDFVCKGIQKYYNCNSDVMFMIFDHVKELKKNYNKWNKEFYKQCIATEKYFKELNFGTNSTDSKTNIHNTINKRGRPTLEKYCEYCFTSKYKQEFKKCGGCVKVRYCSIGCQIKDWNSNHKKICEKKHMKAKVDTNESFSSGTSENRFYDTSDNENRYETSDED